MEKQFSDQGVQIIYAAYSESIESDLSDFNQDVVDSAKNKSAAN
jgi:hypothetical protein